MEAHARELAIHLTELAQQPILVAAELILPSLELRLIRQQRAYLLQVRLIVCVDLEVAPPRTQPDREQHERARPREGVAHTHRDRIMRRRGLATDVITHPRGMPSAKLPASHGVDAPTAASRCAHVAA